MDRRRRQVSCRIPRSCGDLKSIPYSQAPGLERGDVRMYEYVRGDSPDGSIGKIRSSCPPCAAVRSTDDGLDGLPPGSHRLAASTLGTLSCSISRDVLVR